MYYSGKRTLYSYKVEVAVRPNGISSAFSKQHPGFKSVLSILLKRVEKRKARLAKKECDDDFVNEYELCDEYGDSWAILADKWYQGVAEILRVITSEKNLREVYSHAKKLSTTENFLPTVFSSKTNSGGWVIYELLCR